MGPGRAVLRASVSLSDWEDEKNPLLRPLNEALPWD